MGYRLPTARSLSPLGRASAAALAPQSSMFEDALLTYIEAKKVGVEVRLCNFLLKCLVEGNQIMYARSLFDDMKSSGPSPNVYSYSVLMNLEMVYDLWNDMIRHDFVPDIYNYTSLIYALCRHKYLKEALGVFELMLENGVSPNIVTCTILVDSFSKEGLIGEAFLLLDKVHQLGIAPNLCTYKVIINGLCKLNKSSNVWEVFADMIKRGHVPDVVLYSIIIDGFVKALKLQEAMRLYRRMVDEGPKPNIFTYTSLVNGLCRYDSLPETMKLFNEIAEFGLIPDMMMYTSVIACYCRRSNMEAAVHMFKQMKRHGLSPDAFVYTCLISGYSKVLAMDGARLMMEEMQEMDIAPTVVTYTALIVGYFKTGDEKEAKILYRKMLQDGITPDATLSCILGLSNDEEYSMAVMSSQSKLPSAKNNTLEAFHILAMRKKLMALLESTGSGSRSESDKDDDDFVPMGNELTIVAAHQHVAVHYADAEHTDEELVCLLQNILAGPTLMNAEVKELGIVVTDDDDTEEPYSFKRRKDEMSFDSGAWLDSDRDEDFYSMNGVI
ncbi:hypothetical protein EJB05_11297, partial [Eragrostis curvula]